MHAFIHGVLHKVDSPKFHSAMTCRVVQVKCLYVLVDFWHAKSNFNMSINV